MTGLAPYAATEENSRGRVHAEDSPSHRTEFQRDRDRIIHSASFRRLLYKTQVFVNHEGDHYRTRLTHSLEVAQIARTVARAMRLNEDLAEAISLAHDLGHTPFGHAGQDALDECMQAFGGFEHNLQSLRVVDCLEDRYAAFRGLNLTFETREGILKHCTPERARTLGDLGRHFLERRQPGLEAQLANRADEIAYNIHDVDDGLRSGVLRVDDLGEVEFFARWRRDVERRYPRIRPRQRIYEVGRAMIDALVGDLVATSEARIQRLAPRSIDAVRAHEKPLIGFSQPFAKAQRSLKAFLREHLYRHPRVRVMSDEAHRIVTRMFAALRDDFDLMPPEYAQRARAAGNRAGTAGSARVVADYIAGMTDRFAFEAHAVIRDGSSAECSGSLATGLLPRAARMMNVPAPPTRHRSIPPSQRLIVALDVPGAQPARALVEELGEAVEFYKIGLEMMASGCYFELLDWLLERDKQVFADLKFYDIPATVAAAVRRVAGCGASFLTVHGDRAIIEAAASEKGPLKVLAVTVLTSIGRDDLREMGIDMEVESLVLQRARLAVAAGSDGLIASGQEAAALRDALGPVPLIVTPGVRPAGASSRDDQKRVVTPARALADGADYLVLGRPIRNAPSPRRAAEAVQAEIAAALQ